MKKSLLSCFFLLVSAGILSGQSFDWNIRGGINIMDAKASDKNVSALYHFGAQAGVRITNFGFYGEALYSMHENQNTEGDPVAYFVPGIITKVFAKKFLFAELGGVYMVKTGDSGDSSMDLNPEGVAAFVGGLGFHVSKVQLSFRATVKESYPILQVTAAFKF
jgi:hypothetical protein